jgi:hypothetical protein
MVRGSRGSDLPSTPPRARGPAPGGATRDLTRASSLAPASRLSDGGRLLLRRVVCQSRPEVAQRYLGRDLQTALCAISCVTPRPQKTRAVLCEENRKVFALRVDFEAEIWPPIGRHVPRTRLEPLQDSPEPHSFGVEQPGAVARLEDKRFHVPILVAVPCNFLGTGLQVCDDQLCE